MKNKFSIIFVLFAITLTAGCVSLSKAPPLEGLETITFIRNESSSSFYSEATYNKDGTATYSENKNGKTAEKASTISEKEFSELSGLLNKADFMNLQNEYSSAETKGLDSFAIKATVNGKAKIVVLFGGGKIERLLELTKHSYRLAEQKFGASSNYGGKSQVEIQEEIQKGLAGKQMVESRG